MFHARPRAGHFVFHHVITGLVPVMTAEGGIQNVPNSNCASQYRDGLD